MKRKIFNFKLTLSLFMLMLSAALFFLAKEPIHQVKEISKEINLINTSKK